MHELEVHESEESGGGDCDSCLLEVYDILAYARWLMDVGGDRPCQAA